VVAVKGRTLRAWRTLSELVNSLKGLENRIYGQFGSPQGMLVVLIRIAPTGNSFGKRTRPTQP